MLVWDACRSHLTSAVLAAARAQHIGVVIVPARMTWALQPLDTHVFAVLKKRIRDLEFEQKVASHRSCLGPAQRVRLHGQAISEVLVGKSWASVLQRGGLTRDSAELRPALQEMLRGSDITPAFPSKEDLMEALAVREPQALELLSLLAPRPAAAAPGVSAPAGSSGSGVAVAAAAPAAGSAPAARSVTPIVLGRSARLPSRVSLADAPSNVWLPFYAGRTVQTRSMSAAAASAAASAAHSPAPPPAKRSKRAAL